MSLKRIRHRKHQGNEMPPCELPPRSAEKRKGATFCLAIPARGRDSINLIPQPCTHTFVGLRRERKALRNGLSQKRLKIKIQPVGGTQDAGRTRMSTLRSMPELPSHLSPMVGLFGLCWGISFCPRVAAVCLRAVVTTSSLFWTPYQVG